MISAITSPVIQSAIPPVWFSNMRTLIRSLSANFAVVLSGSTAPGQLVSELAAASSRAACNYCAVSTFFIT